MTDEERIYIRYLNEINPECDSDMWIMGGKNRNEYMGSYGLALYKFDPIAFQVGLREFLQEQNEDL